MTVGLRHDRIIPLSNLNHYPGSEWLDVTLYLLWSENTRRRMWLMMPKSSPTISIDDVVLKPQHISNQGPRWIDYGTQELPIRPQHWYLGEFHQLRVRGMEVSECAASYLVITTRPDLLLEGCDIEQAERKLWGLARRDAGSTTLNPSRVTAGSGADFVVRYTAGPRGLPAGALVSFNVDRAFSRPQTENREAPGFVSLPDAADQVSIVTVEESLAWGTEVVCRLERDLGSGQGFSLRYSSEGTYIHPVDFHGTDKQYPYDHLPPLVASVALSEDRPFVSLTAANGHSFQVVPDPSERLHLFLPGRRFVSEKLSLKGTFTDHCRNTPPSGPIDADLELWLESGEDKIALGSPAGHFVARHRFVVPLPHLAPGVYRAIAYRAGTRAEVARSNPLQVIDERAGGERIYWGEIHAHTEMSDGIGDCSELYRHALEEGYLAFASAIDHAEFFSDNEWLWMQDVTNSWNQPGRFVTLVGYETEGKQRDRNVYTSRPRLKLFRGRYPPTSSLDVVWGHFHGDEEVVGGVHALLAHGINWEHWGHHDPSVERFVEIYSMWGASDFRDSRLVPNWIDEWISRGNIHPPMTTNELLQKGAKLGFTGGGDCHQGRCGFVSEDPDGHIAIPEHLATYTQFRCGMTAAVLPRLDRASLIKSIRNRRTYATTGARILLDFTAADLPMGAIGTAKEVVCCATVHAVEPVCLIEIIKDGRVVWSAEFNHLDVTTHWRDPEPPNDEHYYYLHVVQIDGHMAWSSPIWIGPSSQIPIENGEGNMTKRSNECLSK
jgi:hypothetical protein